MNTHNLRIEFGKHKGELWTRVPVSYLKWLVNTPMQNGAGEIAKAELERRGTHTPTLEVSGHAIDRASLSCRAIWHQTALSKDEGLHAWLSRMAAEALAANIEHKGKLLHNGLLFAFVHGELYPVLKTVMPADPPKSLSGGNPGEPKACTPAEERGIAGATGAGQLPDDDRESTCDSVERRSPAGNMAPPAPDESNRHSFGASPVNGSVNGT